MNESSDKPDVLALPNIDDSKPGDEKGAEQRRSTRLLVMVPVTFSGKNAQGDPFREETHTLSVNGQGASLATSQVLAPRTIVLLENTSLGITAKAKIVSFRKNDPMPHQAGVELLEPKNIWGIQYPPHDWRRAPRPAPEPERVRPSIGAAADTAPAEEPLDKHADAAAAPSPSARETLISNSAATLPDLHSPAIAPPPSASPEAVAERLLRAAGLKLAKLAGQVDARLQQNANQALARLDEREQALSSLVRELVTTGEKVRGSRSDLEAFLAQTEEAKQTAQRELQEACHVFRQDLQRASEELVASSTENLGKRLAAQLESAGEALMEKVRFLATEEITSATRDFKEQVRSLASQVESRLTSETADVESFHSRVLNEAGTRLEALLDPALQQFQIQLEQAAQGVTATVLEKLAGDCSTAAKREIESRQPEARERAKDEIEAIASAAANDLRDQIQRMTADFRDSELPSLAGQLTARASTELEARRAGMVVQMKDEIEASSRSVIEAARAELEQSVRNLETSLLPKLTQKVSAQADSELEARRAGMVAQVKGEIETSARSVIEAACAELGQSVRNLEASVLPELTQKVSAQAATMLETAQNDATAKSRSQVEEMTQSGLADFRKILDGAAQDTLDSALAGFASRSTADIAAQHAEALRSFQDGAASAALAAQESLKSQLLLQLEEQKAVAAQIVQKPSEEIAKYAEETLTMVRDQLSELRRVSLDEIRGQFATVTRGTLASITEEARATAEEYRAQLREVFDGLKEKSAAVAESTMKHALEEARETVLHQLQKDAEDLGSAAVVHFRSSAEEAAREATDAINKQVGAAAFVVKDWVDQAATRLEGYIGKMETNSQKALEAIEDRSMTISGMVMEKVTQESEALIADLRRRIQNAASALSTSLEDHPPSSPSPALAGKPASSPAEHPDHVSENR